MIRHFTRRVITRNKNLETLAQKRDNSCHSRSHNHPWKGKSAELAALSSWLRSHKWIAFLYRERERGRGRQGGRKGESNQTHTRTNHTHTHTSICLQFGLQHARVTSSPRPQNHPTNYRPDNLKAGGGGEACATCQFNCLNATLAGCLFIFSTTTRVFVFVFGQSINIWKPQATTRDSLFSRRSAIGPRRLPVLPYRQLLLGTKKSISFNIRPQAWLGWLYFLSASSRGPGKPQYQYWSTFPLFSSHRWLLVTDMEAK